MFELALRGEVEAEFVKAGLQYGSLWKWVPFCVASASKPEGAISRAHDFALRNAAHHQRDWDSSVAAQAHLMDSGSDSSPHSLVQTTWRAPVEASDARTVLSYLARRRGFDLRWNRTIFGVGRFVGIKGVILGIRSERE